VVTASHRLIVPLRRWRGRRSGGEVRRGRLQRRGLGGAAMRISQEAVIGTLLMILGLIIYALLWNGVF
jgi:hypothetical protein